MANATKIFNRLEKEYEYIKTFTSTKVNEPVWFACNTTEKSFRIVSIYLDSEIGGYFTLEDGEQWMEHVCANFDEQQAFELRDTIIEKIERGDAIVLGDIKPEQLH